MAPPAAQGLASQPPAGCPSVPAAHRLLLAQIIKESVTLSLGQGWEHEGL